jgi:hypothetical protein
MDGKQIYEKHLQTEGAKEEKERAEQVESSKEIRVEEVAEGAEEE